MTYYFIFVPVLKIEITIYYQSETRLIKRSNSAREFLYIRVYIFGSGAGEKAEKRRYSLDYRLIAVTA